MRLLQIVRTLNPAWGGTVEAARTLSHSAKKVGVELETVSLDDAGDAWLSSYPASIHAIGKAPMTFGFSQALDRWLESNIAKYDAVIVNGIWMYLSYAVWKAATKHRVPYYLFTHGFLDPWFKKRYPVKHLKKIVYWRIVEHKVIRDAAAVVFTTEEEEILARDSFQPYRAKPMIAGFGIEAPQFANAGAGKKELADAFRQNYPSLGNREYLLFLGRIHEKKGIDLLLKAFARFKAESQGDELSLVVVGPGGEKITSDLKALGTKLGLDKDVLWTGPLYGEAKWNALRSAEALVLSSHQENFGISVVESLACGTPVLISNKVNIWREVEREGAGLIAEDTVDGTFSMLQRWAQTPAERRRVIAASARDCFFKHFDEERCGRGLFASIAAASGQPALAIPQSVHA